VLRFARVRLQDSFPKEENACPEAAVDRSQSRLKQTLTLILRRMAFGVSVLIAVVFLTNLGLDMARGLNFGTAALQSGAQTLEYLGRLARGDLGSSAAGVITGRSLPVAEVIATTLPRSLGLIGASLLAGTLVGCGLGFLAAVHRHRRA